MKKTLILAVVATLGVGYCFIQIAGSEGALKERFPDVDPDTVVKLHREIIKEVLLGKHTSAESDEDYDKIFRQKLTKLNQ